MILNVDPYVADIPMIKFYSLLHIQLYTPFQIIGKVSRFEYVMLCVYLLKLKIIILAMVCVSKEHFHHSEPHPFHSAP